MKITSIETIPVSLPVGKFEDGMDKVIGSNAPSRFDDGNLVPAINRRSADGQLLLSNVIVKITTDEGFVGIGEAACDACEPPEVVTAIIDLHMAPLLLGKDPLDWEVLLDLVTIGPTRGATRFSTSGIDLALFDLVGKILGVPVYALLGGKRRSKVFASIEVPRGEPDVMARHSYEYFQKGVRGIKAKIGSDPERDAASILAIREKLGKAVSIRADANCGYSLAEAKLFCSLVEKLGTGLELLEQPLAVHDFEGMRQLRQATTLPIEVDESAYSMTAVGTILSMRAADIVNTKCAKAGGIRGVRQWAAVADAFDLKIVIGTEWGVGSKVAAKLHLGAALKNVDPVVEFTEIMIHELLLAEPLELDDGYLHVPNGPGLGLAFDESKIERYRIAKLQ